MISKQINTLPPIKKEKKQKGWVGDGGLKTREKTYNYGEEGFNVSFEHFTVRNVTLARCLADTLHSLQTNLSPFAEPLQLELLLELSYNQRDYEFYQSFGSTGRGEGFNRVPLFIPMH